MEQRLVTIAINYEPENESSVSAALAEIFGGTASTIKQATNAIADRIQEINGADVPHWSCSTTQNWQTQQEEIAALYQAMESHKCTCCHQAAEPPAGAIDFEKGECPPEHNCPVCAAVII
jgi:hypothetical protein